MSCLEGSGGQPVRCRCCTQPWDGSSLVLGTMYSYDIFAAMPCCTERLKVTNSLLSWSSNRGGSNLPFVKENIYPVPFFPSYRESYSISINVQRQTNQRPTDGIRWCETAWNLIVRKRGLSVTVQQLPEAAHLPTPAAQLLFGLQPRVRVSALPCSRRPFRETAVGLLHPRPIPAVQPVAVTIRELS